MSTPPPPSSSATTTTPFQQPSPPSSPEIEEPPFETFIKYRKQHRSNPIKLRTADRACIDLVTGESFLLFDDHAQYVEVKEMIERGPTTVCAPGEVEGDEGRWSTSRPAVFKVRMTLKDRADRTRIVARELVSFEYVVTRTVVTATGEEWITFKRSETDVRGEGTVRSMRRDRAYAW